MIRQVCVKDTEFAALSQGILKRGDSLRFRANGFSMTPFILDGDLLTIQSVEGAEFKLGQVIFYLTPEKKCITHRVIAIEFQNDQRILTTKGDASPSSKEKVQENQVLGQVVEIHRGTKCINIGRNLWWILSRHLPGFLHFIYLMLRVQRKIRTNPTYSQENSSLPSQGE